MAKPETEAKGEQGFAVENRVSLSDSTRYEFKEVGQELSGYVVGVEHGNDETTGQRKPFYIRILTAGRGIVKIPVSLNLMVLCKLVGSPLVVFIRYTGATRVKGGDMKQYQIDIGRGKPDETTQLLLETAKAKGADDDVPF